MNQNPNNRHPSGRLAQRSDLRRANTIVLVTGILVLLVIIATAYVTRTGAQRITSGAQQRAVLREDTHRNIGEFLADEITKSLFVHPFVADNVISAAPLNYSPNNANLPRFAPASNALRYGRDVNYPWNAPAFHVVPFTNWPDFMTGLGPDADKLPAGPGHPTGGGFSALLAGEYNPLGAPGIGDTRWLRDIVPQRWASDFPATNELNAFSHYKHLSYIGRADNAWRICTDISDVGDATGDGLGMLVTDLNLPVEQWLAARPPMTSFNPPTGLPVVGNNFKGLYRRWFGMNANGSLPNNTSGRLTNYLNMYVHTPGGANSIPPNFIDLNDVDGDGVMHEPVVNSAPGQERPLDEFDGQSLRWQVASVLADSDGDGFTDSFWWLAPTSIESGIRQVVAISIIDNQGMLNANVATQYVRNDPTGLAGGIDRKTLSILPTDLALIGSGVNGSDSNNWNVGYLDNPLHDWWPIGTEPDFAYKFDYDSARWPQHLQEVGLTLGAQPFLTQAQRREYWLNSASSPNSYPNTRFTPFSLGDELELRMYSGCNYPSIYSRFESSVQDSGDLNGFLRADQRLAENTEYARSAINPLGYDQPSNRRKAQDKREYLTLYNSVRNDIMPPWLWENPNPQPPADGPELKLDLRRADMDPRNNDNDGDGNPNDDDDTRLRLRQVIFRALTDPDSALIPNRNSYNGTGDGTGNNGIQKTRALAASLAANILQYRDDDQDSPLEETIEVQGNPPPQTRFMGIEPQPFILEAFVGHIYKAIEVDPPNDPNGNQYSNAGNFVVTENDQRRSTIVVIQIANPFEEQVDLARFQLTVMGQSVQLEGILPAATPENPATAIFFTLKDQFPGDIGLGALRKKWLDFLDIETAFANPMAAGTIVRDTEFMQPGTPPPGGTPPTPGMPPWNERDRTAYDNAANAPLAVVLTRKDTATSPAIIIDRIDPPDDPKFGNAIVAMANNRPPVVALPPGQYPIDDIVGGAYGGVEGAIDLGLAENGNGFSHWVQWVRATRAWGVDVDNDGQYDANERNPRFVCGDYAVIEPSGALPSAGGTFIGGGNKYRFRMEPDPDVNMPTIQPWFTRAYMKMDGTVAQRQPTFFNMARDLSTISNFPDKGWYSQSGGVDQTPLNNVQLRFPMQMLHKNDDFEHVGEIYNVFMYGHLLRAQTVGGNINYVNTVTTLSEFMSNDTESVALVGRDARVNRLRPMPSDISIATAGTDVGFILGVGDVSNTFDPRHGMPAIPAGARLIDAFVCDGPGVNNPTPDKNFYLAKNYEGTGTPGLVNICTAPVEVLRCIPNFYRLVHETGGAGITPNDGIINPYFNNAGQQLVTDGNLANALLPRVMIPEALESYREQYNAMALTGNPNNDENATGIPNGAAYQNRHRMYSTQADQWMRGDRGFASIGELLSLQNSGQTITQPTGVGGGPPDDVIYGQYWKMDLGVGFGAGDAEKPFWDGSGGGANQVSMRIATDRQDAADPGAPATNNKIPDRVAGDAEEMNMLFSGASNLITTRSDTFTVYFRVRSFRQNLTAVPPVWDATNPDFIVDDSRYVMLVDRSQVNHPGDKPKVLYFEKLPN